MKLPLFVCGCMAMLSLSFASAEIVTQEMSYEVQGVSLSGYLAYDADTTGKSPAVLVVHEWWGHNAYARKRAEMLAELGYVAFALDMYGEGKVTEHPQDAKKFMQEALSNQELLQERFNAAVTLVKQQENVDAIKYCRNRLLLRWWRSIEYGACRYQFKRSGQFPRFPVHQIAGERRWCYRKSGGVPR